MKQIIKRILIITLYMGLILISTNVYARTAKAKEETVRIRKEASTSSSIVALMSQNEEVEILKEEGDWYQVKYSNYTGYVRKDMLSVKEDDGEENKNTTTNQEAESEQKDENMNRNNVSEENANTTSTSEENNNNSSEEQKSQNSTEEENNNISSEQQSTANSLQKGYSGKLTSKLEIKILPLINSSIISTLDENTQITIIEIINKWCYIETQNNSGWTLMSKVKTEETNNKEEPKQEEQENKNDENESKEEEKSENENKEENKKEEKNTETIKYVSAETLNVREEADNNSKIISQLTLNTKVTVVENVNNTWAKITTKGKTGYVANKYLSDKKVEASSRSEDLKRENTDNKKEEEQKDSNKEVQKEKEDTSNNQSSTGTSGANVVAFAQKYLGYRYVSGGASPSTGFDCSGFTTYVYKNFGISLSRTSGAQASNGTAVSKGNLQPGDLVIFNNSSNSAVGHVGIYIGGNTFIHAANARKGVITTSLSDSYYSPRFVTGRRVIH